MYRGKLNKMLKKEVRSLDLREMGSFRRDGSYDLLPKRAKNLFERREKALEKIEGSYRTPRKNLEKKALRAFPSAVRVCTALSEENCGNRAADTPGSFCGGNNCGWCHHTHVEYSKGGEFMYCVSLSEHEFFEEEDVD